MLCMCFQRNYSIVCVLPIELDESELSVDVIVYFFSLSSPSFSLIARITLNNVELLVIFFAIILRAIECIQYGKIHFGYVCGLQFVRQSIRNTTTNSTHPI